MKKLTKLLPYVVVFIFAIIFAILRPWQYISLLPIVGQNAALTVKTSFGKSEVYLNGKKIGETPLSSENLRPGDYQLEIKRLTEEDSFYTDISRLIHLEPNTRTFVETEIGPSEQFSSVIVLYYKRNKNTDTTLYLDSTPGSATIWIDDIRYGTSPITASKLADGTHKLKISKSGYESLTTTLIIRDGYTLISNIQLMAQPVNLDKKNEYTTKN